MIFYIIAAIFAFLGVIFWVIDTLDYTVGAKKGFVLCIILSGATLALKIYLKNSVAINGFFRENF